MIDAECRSEEKFYKLSLTYEGKEEGKRVCSAVDKIVDKYDSKPEMFTCNISDEKEIVVVEYPDNVGRLAGAIFDEIMKELDIDKCI